MSVCLFLLLAAVFGYLAYDAYQFQASSRHQVWSAPPTGRAVGTDPLSRPAQEGAQANRYTAIGGIPGLYWVFVALSLACLAAALWLWWMRAG
jgi:hypothetical protein